MDANTTVLIVAAYITNCVTIYAIVKLTLLRKGILEERKANAAE